jgi:hypothetical protein
LRYEEEKVSQNLEMGHSKLAVGSCCCNHLFANTPPGSAIPHIDCLAMVTGIFLNGIFLALWELAQ